MVLGKSSFKVHAVRFVSVVAVSKIKGANAIKTIGTSVDQDLDFLDMLGPLCDLFLIVMQ